MKHPLNVKFPGIVARVSGDSLVLEDQWTVRADEMAIKQALGCQTRRQAMRVLKGGRCEVRSVQRGDR
jgi:hypothetical protein